MVQAIEVPTVFSDFDDYWRPFLGAKVRHPGSPDGSIPLMAGAWAVRGLARG
jgi:hypothetical protein